LKEDRITGLTVGGDDYITKPFSIEELVLKIEVFLKRSTISKKKGLPNTEFIIGDYKFIPRNYQLKFESEVKNLTSREVALLKYFVLNVNKVLKKEDILTEVWGDDSYFNSRSLDVFVSKLRKHLKKDPNIKINNIHGIGFILSDS